MGGVSQVSGGREMLQVGKREINSRGDLSSFNFRGADQQKKVGDLSGGERNRLHLAKTLMTGGNLLMLDEPTNDLDVDTLRALEAVLLDFSGCAVIMSHDRWFLDRVATHILAFEGNSETMWFEGNDQAYKEDLKKRKGVDAASHAKLPIGSWYGGRDLDLSTLDVSRGSSRFDEQRVECDLLFSWNVGADQLGEPRAHASPRCTVLTKSSSALGGQGAAFRRR